MSNSLFGRLLISSLILLCVFFSVIYYAISQAFISDTVAAKKEQLQLQNYLLLSAASIEKDTIQLPEELREVRFDEYESGLYGFIHDQQGKILWSSYSAHDLTIDTKILAANISIPGQSQFRQTEKYLFSHYLVEWEIIDDLPQLITFTVMEDVTPTQEKIARFRNSLLQLLGLGALALVFALLIVLRWGTLPLSKLAREIKAIENGDQQRLDGNYPVELQGLSRNLNQLIDTEQQQRERYQNTLADLAHSLKTPLAVIKVELESGKNDASHSLITEQSLRMEDIITHQLQRAVIAAPNKLSDKIPVSDVVDQLCSALVKVYADKAVNIEQEIEQGCVFRGDKRDLMEILGNITDNACKACHKTVRICGNSDNGQLNLEIHDDGKGISEYLREQVLQRGRRLDSKSSGQGIGLDVVTDIVSSYQGTLAIEQSSLGGALFKLSLPG